MDEPALIIDVSVCIPNYNGLAVLRECLDAVLAQEIEQRLEVLVYDDGSTDDSVAVVTAEYPGVRLLSDAQNRGFSHACNSLAAAATGRYLLFLNNDAFLEPGALAALCRAAQETPRALLSLRQIDAENGELLDLGMGLDLLTVPYPLYDTPSPHLATLIGACLWVPAELFAEAGGFPAWFGSIAEDLYLCQFARLRGRTLHLVDGPAYRHHSGWSFGGGKADRAGQRTSYRRRFLSERNRACVFLIFFPWYAVLLLLPLWLLSWALECLLLCLGRLSLQPATRIYGPALAGVIALRGDIADSRRRVQAMRKISFREFLAPFRWLPSKLRFFWEHGLPRLG